MTDNPNAPVLTQGPGISWIPLDQITRIDNAGTNRARAVFNDGTWVYLRPDLVDVPDDVTAPETPPPSGNGWVEMRGADGARAWVRLPQPMAPVAKPIDPPAPTVREWQQHGIALRHSPTILVTGGTGSLGRALVEHLLATTDAHVRVLSRDEHKQEAMARVHPPSERLTYILGDLRDERRVREAVAHCSHVVHAAALKTVPGGARHMSEFVAVNVTGTENVIRAVIDEQNINALFISTDKAVDPLNAYGKSKAVAEELWIQANARGHVRGARFAAVRGGNVWMSAGSVGRVWAERIRSEQPLEVYNGQAITRFHMRMPWWVEFVRARLATMVAGTTYVPIVPAWRLEHLAAELAMLGVEVKHLGARPGDKLHETMVAAHESPRVHLLGGRTCAIAPSDDLRSVWHYPVEELDRYVEPIELEGAFVTDHFGAFTSEATVRISLQERRACAMDVFALAKKESA